MKESQWAREVGNYKLQLLKPWGRRVEFGSKWADYIYGLQLADALEAKLVEKRKKIKSTDTNPKLPPPR